MDRELFGFVSGEVARRGGGRSELYLQSDRVRRFDARGGCVDALSFSDTLTLGLRVFRNGRMGFSYGFRRDEDAVARMVEEAVFGADSSDPDPAYGLPDGDGEPPDADLYDPEWESLDDRRKAEFASSLEDAVLSRDKRMKRVRSASLKEAISRVRYWNSDGCEREGRLSRYFASVDAVAEEGDEGQTGYGFGFARRFFDLSIDAVADEAAGRALRMLGSGRLRTGRMPAVLENAAAADLVETLSPSFLAPNVVKGKSMLAGKIGREVVSRRLTVADDPLDPGGSGSEVFDGEGTPSRKTALVEDGVLLGYLCDAFWGRKMGTGSTSGSRRPGPKVPPTAGPSNIRVSPGKKSLDELVRAMGSGILITEFLGIHTADPVSGDFSVGAAGIRIEGGREAGPVRGFAVSGNVLALLSGVVDAGSDFRWFGTIGTPSLALTEIAVGGE
jgi:PmbA protein